MNYKPMESREAFVATDVVLLEEMVVTMHNQI